MLGTIGVLRRASLPHYDNQLLHKQTCGLMMVNYDHHQQRRLSPYGSLIPKYLPCQDVPYVFQLVRRYSLLTT
jgi:hypothetical protein